MMNTFCKYRFLLLLLQVLTVQLIAQNTAIPENSFRNNIIKINIIPIAESISGDNQKWMGIEYERFIKPGLSVSVLVNFGLFEDYTFTKYYDYFDEHDGFSYIRKDVKTKGYHFIPSAKYYFLKTKKKKGQGIYVGGCIDFNQYFKYSETYSSLSNSFSYENSSTTRVGIGAAAGGQFVAFTRLTIDLNISIFTKLFSIGKGQNNSTIPPLHATWVFNNSNSWSTVSLMIGYAFGGGKKK
jgi:hypothetical protein